MNPNQNSRFTPVNPSSNGIRWEPQKSVGLVIDPNNPPALEGYFTSFDQRSGPNGAFMSATVTTISPDGSIGDDYDVAGGVGLENTLRETPLNTYIRIEFHGKKTNPKNGRTFNDFKVFKDEHAIRYDQRPDVIATAQSLPQRQAPAPAVQQPVFNQHNPQFNQQPQPGMQQNNAFLQQGQQQQFQQPTPQTNINTLPPAPQQQSFPPANPQPPVFNNPTTFQPQVPAQQQQSFQAPPVVPPAQQKPFTPPPAQQFQAPPQQQNFQQQQAPQNPQNGQFGGQQVSGNPFTDDLPF